jgi:hypothetical protein
MPDCIAIRLKNRTRTVRHFRTQILGSGANGIRRLFDDIILADHGLLQDFVPIREGQQFEQVSARRRLPPGMPRLCVQAIRVAPS